MGSAINDICQICSIQAFVGARKNFSAYKVYEVVHNTSIIIVATSIYEKYAVYA
jgi:hypothetical protein